MSDESQGKPYRDEIKSIWETSEHPLGDLWKWAKEPDDREKRADRFAALAEWAGSHKRQADHDSDEWRTWRKRQRVYRKRQRANQGDNTPDVPPMVDGGWHPDARRVGVVSGIGELVGPHRIVWHTTEGYGLPTYSGSNPHFTLDPQSGTLYQHQDVRQGARALVNAAGGVETNRRGAIQIELIGFAAQSPNWSDQAYEHIADLARWIEAHCGVKREATVKFGAYPNALPPRMSASQWNSYNGHCGHQHVPENEHGDPRGLRIDEVLA